eukprot:6213527-Pyramimonas_sp.AAC.1
MAEISSKGDAKTNGYNYIANDLNVKQLRKCQEPAESASKADAGFGKGEGYSDGQAQDMRGLRRRFGVGDGAGETRTSGQHVRHAQRLGFQQDHHPEEVS